MLIEQLKNDKDVRMEHVRLQEEELNRMKLSF